MNESMRSQWASRLATLCSSDIIDSSDNLRRTMPIVPWSILQAIRLEEVEEKLGSFVAMERLVSFLSLIHI